MCVYLFFQLKCIFELLNLLDEKFPQKTFLATIWLLMSLQPKRRQLRKQKEPANDTSRRGEF